jgi:putative membrane protein
MVGNRIQRLSALMTCASLVAVGACSGRNGDANRGDSANTATASGDVARDTAAAATNPAGGAAGTTSPSGSAGSSAMTITGGDPEIIQVMATVDQGEIADGQMAQKMARNSQVKAFARELVSAHTKSLSQDKALAKATGVQLMSSTGTTGTTGKADSAKKADTASSAATSGASSQMSPVATQLQTMHQQTAERLRGLQGAAFDTAFINAQVMGHQQALQLLQSSGTVTQNTKLSTHIATATKEVQDHLDRAQKIQQSLASGGTGMGDSTSKSKTGSDTGRKGN